MRTIQAAAVTTAMIGLSFAVVGCGPMANTGSVDTSGVAKATGKAGEVMSQATKRVADDVGELTRKVKAATEEVNTELSPLTTAFEELKTKIANDEKAAGTDAVKLTAVNKLKDLKADVQKLMNEIQEKLGGLAAMKDVKGLDDVKKAVMDLIEKVKPMLKDFMPTSK